MNASTVLRAISVAVILAFAGCSAPPPAGGLLPVSSSARRPAERAAGSSAAYLYVENGNSTIAAYGVAKNGALTPVAGSPYASQTIGPAQFSIAVDPKGPYLYATGTVSDNVAVFSIGSGGALTVESTKTNAGDGAGFLLLQKGADRLYVVNEVNGGTLAAFSLAKKGLKLKPLAGSPFQVTCPGFCDPNPDYAVISGSYLYTVDTYGWYVSTFSISAGGALTELNNYATGYGPAGAVATPNGAYLYVTNGAEGSVSAYGIAGGVLTPLAGSPFAAGGTPQGIAIAPNGKHVYVANEGDGTISGYSVGSGGALSALAGSPFADGDGVGPTALTVDPSGKHLYVTNQSADTIAVYAIAASGALSQIAGSPFADPSGNGPRGLVLYEP